MERSTKDRGHMVSRLFLICLLGALAAAVAAGVVACGEPGAGKRLVILGFDGVDPDWVEEGFRKGRYPNLARLAKKGAFLPLGSTNPPQSPVAWSSFSTGTRPGAHRIFDFIKRDPKTYKPAIAFRTEVSPATFFAGVFPYRGASAKNLRHGESFWKVASDGSVRVTVLNVPYTFPPDSLSSGRMLSGLGTPDILGFNSMFFYFGTDLTEKETAEGVGGGRLVRLQGEGNRFHANLPGPVTPLGKDAPKLSLPLEIHLDRDAGTARLLLGDEEHEVTIGKMSPWYHPVFKVNTFYKFSGACRAYLLETAPEVRLYVTPIGYDPDAPLVAFSDPEDYAANLSKEHGEFKTVGWVHDTAALNAERVPESVFLDDLWFTMKQREKMTLAELAKDDWDLFISVFTATDRVAHMFYRLRDKANPRYDAALAREYGDAIERVYDRMDEIVGRIVERLEDETRLLIVSDHGFHSFRRGFNTNTWLARNGYLALVPDAQKRRFGKKKGLFHNTDWYSTKAYALGTGQIYVNLAGRERDGIVRSGTEYDRLVREIAGKIEQVRDPRTGARVIKRAYIGAEIFPGADPALAPDIQLAFADGYRTAWSSILGAAPEPLVEPNMMKWSGDHAASDVRETAGILFSSQAVARSEPEIIDIAPTVFKYFGVDPPAETEGKSLF